MSLCEAPIINNHPRTPETVEMVVFAVAARSDNKELTWAPPRPLRSRDPRQRPPLEAAAIAARFARVRDQIMNVGEDDDEVY